MFGSDKGAGVAKIMREAEESIRGVVEGAVRTAMSDTNDVLRRAKTVRQLTEEIETLKIEKGRIEEANARSLREVEHKVGLEKQRQEQELALGKREAIAAVREENLKADRARFDEQLKFHEERFTQEVGYLKEMIGQVLDRVPKVEIGVEQTSGARTRK